jgi:hypothetical protein
MGCHSTVGHQHAATAAPSHELVARAAEPDDPAARPAQAIAGTPRAAAADPLAPITADEILPASARGPAGMTTYPPGTILSGGMAPPVPTSMPAGSPSAYLPPAGGPGVAGLPPIGPGQMCNSCGGPHAAVGSDCCDEVFDGMINNMSIYGGFDYFMQSGTGERYGGMIGANAGAPITDDGSLCYQLGFNLMPAEIGMQSFLTAGLFHRANPAGGLSLNMGIVYDLLYDENQDFTVGQIRMKIGSAFTPRDEVGAWFNITTNSDLVDHRNIILDSRSSTNFTEILAQVQEVEIEPVGQGSFFWRHLLGNGADLTVYIGLRDDPGSVYFGGMTNWPLSDYCALYGGGHWGEDTETFDVYTGVAYYPGGRARGCNSCGHRFMPYQDVANNTYLNVFFDSRKDIVFENIQRIKL